MRGVEHSRITQAFCIAGPDNALYGVGSHGCQRRTGTLKMAAA